MSETILQRVRDDLCNIVSSDLHIFPVGEILRQLMVGSMEVIYSSSPCARTLNAFGICLLNYTEMDMSDVAVSSSTYCPSTKSWVFRFSGCVGETESLVRASYVATYISTVMTTYPLFAARICDISLCTLRSAPRLRVSASTSMSPMFRGSECLYGRLVRLRASSAFDSLVSDVYESDDLKDAGAGEAREDGGGDVEGTRKDGQ